MKTIEQKQAEVLNYFDKTSQHLFITKSGMIFKILTFKHEDKLYYVKLIIRKDDILTETREAFKYGMGLKQEWKRSFFQDDLEIKAIKHFKKFREIECEFIANMTIDNLMNQKLINEVAKGSKFFELEVK